MSNIIKQLEQEQMKQDVPSFRPGDTVEVKVWVVEGSKKRLQALKQLYPNAQNVEWEMKGDYYVADCWVTGDELDVWFDANANWVMTENELDSIDQLVPAVYTGFRNSNYSSWVVTDVFVLTYPQHPTESVIQVKQGNLRFALYFSQEGGLLHERDITNGDDTNWPVME